MPTFTPPTVSYAWPTGEPLTSRIKIPRGLTVISDGHGGWIQKEFPYMGDFEIDIDDSGSYPDLNEFPDISIYPGTA